MSKKLKKLIEKKLDQLSKLLDNISEVQVLDPNDPNTWDSDALYSLAEDLKEALQLLEGETGLCVLMDDYLNESEEEDD